MTSFWNFLGFGTKPGAQPVSPITNCPAMMPVQSMKMNKTRQMTTRLIKKATYSVLLLSALLCASVSYAAPGWKELTAEEQKVLQRHSETWDSMPDVRRDFLLNGAQRWSGMSPAQRKMAQKRFRHWKSLTDAQRKRIRERYQRYRDLTPAQQKELKRNFKDFKSKSAAERRRIREEFQNLPADERRAKIRELQQRRLQDNRQKRLQQQQERSRRPQRPRDKGR